MPIAADEKARYHNVIYKKVAKFPASHGAGALGADTNGVSIHTFTKQGFVASVKAFTSDTANNGIWLYIKDGSTIMPEAAIDVPLNSGANRTTAQIDGLANAGVSSKGDWVEQSGKRVIPVAAGQEVKASLMTALGVGEELYVTCAIYERE